MGRHKNFLVDRTEEDDILDALSLRINETLKTEKKIDDKKNNVYFWLFKFIILLIYLGIINIVLISFGELGRLAIYHFSNSLRSVFVFFWDIFINFFKDIISLYVVFKNLKIFMNSSYYKRLYSNDKEMYSKKNKFFKVLYLIFKYLSVPYLLGLSFISAIVLSIFIVLVYTALNGVYSVSLMVISLAIFGICYSVFNVIQNKFLDKKSSVTLKSGIVVFSVFLLGIVLFGYEFGNYSYENGLPLNFETEKKVLYFDIESNKDIIIKTRSKYDNMKFFVDDSLEDEIRIELEYFETADVNYISHFNSRDDLYLEFDSDVSFELVNVEDVVKLSYETIKDQTIYNYNMFKYPTIDVYVNSKNISKVTLLDYKDDIKEYIGAVK